jgi:uncharacterized protein DUF6941
MKVTLLLADAAQAVQGKLYILGGAWSITGSGPITMALAINIEVPWTEANTPHQLRIALFDEDGQIVHIPTPTGEQPFEFHIPFEVGRPVGLRPGTPLTFALALNLAPFLLRPDSRYVWRCFINGETDDAWHVSFSTRPQQSPQSS